MYLPFSHAAAMQMVTGLHPCAALSLGSVQSDTPCDHLFYFAGFCHVNTPGFRHIYANESASACQSWRVVRPNDLLDSRGCPVQASLGRGFSLRSARLEKF